MSLQSWWWQIFISIQLWSQFFQMFVYSDAVYAQTWYWPWKTVSSHLHMPAYVFAIWPSFLFDSFVKIWETCEIFLGKWFTAPPGKKFPYAYVDYHWLTRTRKHLALQYNIVKTMSMILYLKYVWSSFIALQTIANNSNLYPEINIHIC